MPVVQMVVVVVVAVIVVMPDQCSVAVLWWCRQRCAGCWLEVEYVMVSWWLGTKYVAFGGPCRWLSL